MTKVLAGVLGGTGLWLSDGGGTGPHCLLGCSPASTPLTLGLLLLSRSSSLRPLFYQKVVFGGEKWLHC